jgi:hypothetical protein
MIANVIFVKISFLILKIILAFLGLEITQGRVFILKKSLCFLRRLKES